MKKAANTFWKVTFIGLIIGLLLIGNACIGGKVNERERARDHAVREISSAAGGRFYVKDVYIGIPYTKTIVTKESNGKEKISNDYGTVYFQPESVKYDVNLNTQMRKLGIYSSPIYSGKVLLNCNFNFTLPKNDSVYTYRYGEAFATLKVSDRSLISQPELSINNKTYATILTGSSSEKKGLTSYFNCSSGKIKLSTSLDIRGAELFSANLFSTETVMDVKADWKSPGFSSDFDYLPDTYNISDDGFTAHWNIPFDSGNGSNEIGFRYVLPVDIFKMVHRAVNYGFLFIIIPFIVLFLFELFAGINLHPLHYLLSGAASVIFFLLVLSFSEHINFLLAYIISALASGLLVSFYVGAITHRIKLGFEMSAVFVMMYGYLFFSLKSEDYALLIGSMFAFIVLAIVMFCTRNVDWNKLKILKTKNEAEEIEQEKIESEKIDPAAETVQLEQE